ncbi:MAG: hypothetical protein M1840_002535 [Geoglossum simile]|nr:MAG: hypothetical protein M1840_002535 [Geoglossum simile]
MEVYKSLCAVAVSENDWLKALGHVYAIFKLLQGRADLKSLFGCHLQCAQCLIELGEGTLAGRHFLRAYDLLGELDEQEYQPMEVDLTRAVARSEAFIAYVSREPTSNALNSGGQRSLDCSEQKALCEMIDIGTKINEAEEECMRKYEELKVTHEKLNERLACLGVN